MRARPPSGAKSSTWDMSPLPSKLAGGHLGTSRASLWRARAPQRYPRSAPKAAQECPRAFESTRECPKIIQGHPKSAPKTANVALDDQRQKKERPSSTWDLSPPQLNWRRSPRQTSPYRAGKPLPWPEGGSEVAPDLSFPLLFWTVLA